MHSLASVRVRKPAELFTLQKQIRVLDSFYFDLLYILKKQFIYGSIK